MELYDKEMNRLMDLSNIMVNLLNSALTGKNLDQQTISELQLHNPVSNADLFRLASSHSVANVVSMGLLQNGFSIENTPYETAELQAAYSDAQIEATMDSIRTLFEKNRIPFISLKALVLKNFYPESSMRTCGDIDVLVRKVDISRTVDCLVSNLGYKAESYNHHDVALTSPDNLHMELHFSTSYDEKRLDSVLARIWDYAVPIDDCFEYKLTDDFFLFYMIAHTYHHFVTGGCGVRFFMDLWVIRHRMGIEYTDTVRELCADAGIEKFAESVLLLSEVWFGEEAEHTELTLAMEDYIFSGGTFGSNENAAARVSLTEKKTGRIRYNLHRMFLPYSKLKLLYPQMKKWQFLFYEVKRWMELLRKGSRHRIMIVQKSGKLSEEKKESVRKLFSELEIN